MGFIIIIYGIYIIQHYLKKKFFFLDQVLKFHPRLGDIVKVFSKPKKTFYRARIIKTLNEEWYDVINIDLGGIEKVPSSCIYELAEELQEKV